MRYFKKLTKAILTAACVITLSGCMQQGNIQKGGVTPLFSFPVTNNDTPYSQCLERLRKVKWAKNLPTFSVGEVADKTGQFDVSTTTGSGHPLTQGVSEMVISALAKTGKVHQVERLDLRIPLAEFKLAEQGHLSRSIADYPKLPASNFIIVGALTELNYNIVSGGTQLYIKGIGGGARMVIINVALDLRVIDARNFRIVYVSSLQKQIYGYEVEANVFRFFGNTLVEFDGGAIRNEPMQLGVRSVVEMAVYQIMTDFLGLPVSKDCKLMKTDGMSDYLDKIAPHHHYHNHKYHKQPEKKETYNE